MDTLLDGSFVITWMAKPADLANTQVYSYLVPSAPLQFPSMTLLGGDGADVLLGGDASDTLIGCAGADTIDNRGRAADGDKVLFGSGIARDQLWFEHIANDLKVSVIGTTDSVTVEDWYLFSANHVATVQTADGSTLGDAQVENLVSAMAGMSPPPLGQTTLTTQQHQSLDPVIAANWQHL